LVREIAEKTGAPFTRPNYETEAAREAEERATTPKADAR